MAGEGGAAGLPRPARDRFQPLRGGLVNLFRYDDQQFGFEDGHLLLRGNNGTGKSRVLALQLPFLLDGEVAPHRMEPDGDPAKRAEWNLLLGGRYPDRLGYTWLELGRLAPGTERDEEYVTLGCGLSAAAGRGLVGRWFFITSKRIGRDLHLVTGAGQALSRERLGEALGESGYRLLHARRPTGKGSTRRCSGSAKRATRRWSTCSSSSDSRNSRGSSTRRGCPRRCRRRCLPWHPT